MEPSNKSPLEQAVARYLAGTPATDLLEDFAAITAADPHQSSGWTCFAWLQLLCDQPENALRSARMAVKLNSQDLQARVNLSLAMLETGTSGVRDQIKIVQRVISITPEMAHELRESVGDGLQRRPGWPALLKVKTWLEI